ncbi:MAG: hypothetical protein LBE38_03470 [Deltaproteobacteria bacterium]|jgi:hypothetical protein|nr:hypothetical protein [Deltaproteobacteria bacterium]
MKDVYKFQPKTLKVPWPLCSVSGVFVLPQFISAYQKYHGTDKGYELSYQQEHHSVLFHNTESLLDTNDLHILQGLYSFEKPYNAAQHSRFEEGPVLSHSNIREVAISSQNKKNLEYMMVEENVVNFLQKIKSPLITFPLAEQIKLFGMSLFRLVHQVYNLKIELNNKQKYTEVNQAVHGFSIEQKTGDFSTIRAIVPEGKVFHQPKEIVFNEIIAIESDATRLLHHLLSSKIAPGDKALVSQATLEEYLHFVPGLIEFDDKKKFIEEALFELMSPAIGWEISKGPGDDIWSIQRKNYSLSSH